MAKAVLEQDHPRLYALAAGHGYFSLAYNIVSPNGAVMAFAVDTDGSEVYRLLFRNLEYWRYAQIRRNLNVYYSGAWTDNENFFYTTLDETKRPYRLWRRKLGSAAPDALVYEETDARFNISIERTRSGKYLLLGIDSHASSEASLSPFDLQLHGGEFQLLRPRIQDVEYYADHCGGFSSGSARTKMPSTSACKARLTAT